MGPAQQTGQASAEPLFPDKGTIMQQTAVCEAKSGIWLLTFYCFLLWLGRFMQKVTGSPQSVPRTEFICLVFWTFPENPAKTGDRFHPRWCGIRLGGLLVVGLNYQPRKIQNEKVGCVSSFNVLSFCLLPTHPIYIPTCLPTYLPTHLICLPNLPTHLIYLPNLPTYLLNLPT